MFREFIDKLKAKKRQLQNYKTNNDIAKNKPIKEENSNFEITISNEKTIMPVTTTSVNNTYLLVSSLLGIGILGYVKKSN